MFNKREIIFNITMIGGLILSVKYYGKTKYHQGRVDAKREMKDKLIKMEATLKDIVTTYENNKGLGI